MTGHAIEARLYAENPANHFLPVTGDLLLWREPAGEGIRVDGGIQTGDIVPIHYDPMLAKLIAHGPDRKTAVRRLIRALETTTLLGFTHNIPFLRDVLRQPEFQAGNLTTHFLDDYFADWQPAAGDVNLALIAASVAQFERHVQLPQSEGYWRNNPNQPQLYRYQSGEVVLEVGLTAVPRQKQQYILTLSTETDTQFAVTLVELTAEDVTLIVDGWRRRVTAVSQGNHWWLQSEDGIVHLQAMPRLPRPEPAVDAGGSLRAPMPGSVIAVLVTVGQEVSAGQALMKLEAMKMEHTICAAAEGVVEEIYYTPGDTVAADAQLLTIRK